MSFNAGTNVGQYRIIEQLGQGGMATVYKAYHPSLDRYVAIKVLHQAFLEDPNFLARFQREARLVARLEHSNIVPIYDYAEHEGQPYLVMKFIEGETLKAHLQRGPLNATEVENVVDAVGAALAYAHRQGILHRDIKPSNVILSKEGILYLADFGLARIAQSGESTLTSDMVLGTPQYISPEQAMAKKDLDEGTDIYSFGVMVYEMTVGRVPFSADTPFSVIHDHIYSPLPLPSSVNPHISPELERVLLKALAKDRADRYKDVPAFVEAFKQAWRSSATTQAVSMPASAGNTVSTPSAPLTMAAAQPTTQATQSTPAANPSSRKPFSRWWWLAGVAGLLMCCLAVFVVVRMAQQDENLPAADPPVNIEVTVVAGQPPADAVPTVPAPAGEPGQPQPAPQNPGSAADEGAPVELKPISVEAARKLAEERPEDPFAHAQYGAVLVKNNQAEAGYAEIILAADLARDDVPFLLGAGRAFDKGQIPLGAVIMYLQAGQKMKAMPDLSLNALHRNIYYGFADPLAPEVLDYDKIGDVDEPLSQVAEARYILTHGDPSQAQPILDELRRTKPEMPEIELLQAELLMRQNSFDEAQKILDGLLNRPNLPEWVSQQAREMKSKLK